MTVLVIVAAAAAVVLLPVIQKLLVSEIEGWLPHLSRRLVEIAAHRLPERHRERYIEEWLGELSGFDDRRLTALIWSLDLVRGSRSLGLELADVLVVESVPRPGLKRAFDVIGATFMLVSVAPIIAVIALAIRLESTGPIFSRQWRIGRDARPFEMFRFRTTIARPIPPLEPREFNAVEARMTPSPAPAMTRVGRVLRRTALAEIPQIFNVLLGHMSLVGPRPVKAQLIILDEYQHVTRMTPGMTGPVQLSGFAQVAPTDLLAINDAYVRDWSAWQDIKSPVYSPGRRATRSGTVAQPENAPAE